jgi:hypothetical protein
MSRFCSAARIINTGLPLPFCLLHVLGAAAGTTILPVTPAAALPAPEPEVFYCDPCEKDFKVESQYKAHLATHVSCMMPGCTFSASQRVVKDHVASAHGNGTGDGG